MSTNYIGQPVSRVDGRAKVTGQAKYAGEYNVPNLLYGFVVSSTIAKGRIARIDADEALHLDGVRQVFTHMNAPHLKATDESFSDEVAPPGSPFRPLHDDQIRFNGQPVGLVVATSFELARYAATLVRVDYAVEPHETDLRRKLSAARKPKPRPMLDPPTSRGDFRKAFTKSPVQLDVEYAVPAEHHNPMEPFATTVVWNNGKLTIYDKTQGARNNHGYVCRVFGLANDDVRVLCPFVGGAFGAGLRPQYQLFLAVMAALELKCPVRVTLTRQQMFTLGRRPQTIQQVALGAKKDGTLKAVLHEAVAEASQYEDYSETVVNWSGQLYKCKNVQLGYQIARLDVSTPCDMRAPGAAWGLFALESAMDELAFKLRIDPLELRLRNYTEKDLSTGKRFSSKELRECYRQGAERFGWARRPPAPRSMRDGDRLVGWGMASGVWDSWQLPAAAKAVLTADGKLTVGSATADIGTGTYTIMTQIAAEAMGLSIADVTFQLGDSSLPNAPVEGGSFSAASVGSAVLDVCKKLRKKAFKLARKVENSPLADARFKDVAFVDGTISLRSDPSQKVGIVDAMRFARVRSLEVETAVKPKLVKQLRYTRQSHTAIFAEVKVDEDLGTIEVSRIVTAVAAGRILNPKTAHSQIMGGIVWGLGMALEEASLMDQKFGRFMNHNLAEYHVPVNADVHEIDVIFVAEKDSIVNPLGAKGLGEPGVVGVAAAIANAIFHATGIRVRELPITLDKLLATTAAVREEERPAA
jgi:xanthine dehydrogenase YagR molybdenum-binding subunit